MQWLAKVLGQTSDIMNNNCENNDTNTKDLTKTIKLLSTIKGTTHIIPIPLAPGSHPSMPINYLNIELNPDFETNPSSPYLAYISYTGRVGCVWVTAIRYLCDEHRAVELFVTKLIAIGSQYGTLANCPNLEVAAMHFMYYSSPILPVPITNLLTSAPSVSEHNPIDYLGLPVNDNFKANTSSRYLPYKSYTVKWGPSLNTCPDIESAGIVNPMFYTLHTFDVQFILPVHEVNEINGLRQMFVQKGPTGHPCPSIINEQPVPTVKSIVTIHKPVPTITEGKAANVKSIKTTKSAKPVVLPVHQSVSTKANPKPKHPGIKQDALKYLPNYEEAVKVYPIF
ncbi:unnamed protein product [Oppiella nova]|uniref:Uncharacterized protein n=1 Tax=Oppiella nova TaxID=334625 RepID=A0A7R9QQK5_9ACAR|nr:unnamed protein product [Oppiella nova]CAG2171830.1 unnamed protein product [Oppiella nova]